MKKETIKELLIALNNFKSLLTIKFLNYGTIKTYKIIDRNITSIEKQIKKL
jgi:hypothetical protein